MNKRSILWLLMLSIVLVTACKPSKQKMESRINGTEERLFNAETGYSPKAADSLVQLYQEFAGRFPGDSLSPGYLFKAASLLMNIQRADRSIALFRQVMERYPEHSKAPLALFFIGFVQENQLGLLDQARQSYMLFLEKYPGHDFADDARASIENLGKTPEQMIEEFEARRKADSLQAATGN
jgi:TolA-binding protein